MGRPLRWVGVLPDARLGKVRVPVLPLVDLLILLGTGSLLIGFLLKAIAITPQPKNTRDSYMSETGARSAIIQRRP